MIESRGECCQGSCSLAYLSGNFGARGWGISAIGSQGYAYVTGTTSTGFPVTTSAFEAVNFNSGFLMKLCTNCSGAASLVYSTFLAHTGFAEGRAVAADVAGNAYITGNVNSMTLDQFVDAVLLTVRDDEGADLTAQRAALIALGSRGAVCTAWQTTICKQTR